MSGQGRRRPRQQPPQRQRQAEAGSDGDVNMLPPKTCGGRKVRNRKRRRQLGAGDVDMEDAPEVSPMTECYRHCCDRVDGTLASWGCMS